MVQKIIGIVGRIGAGKDTVAEYIARKYRYAVVAFRDAVKDATEKEGLEATRANMQAVSKKYRDRYGAGYFTGIILKKIDQNGPKVIVKEMRTDGDVLPLKKTFPGMKIILVHADAETPRRLRNLKNRKSGRKSWAILRLWNMRTSR